MVEEEVVVELLLLLVVVVVELLSTAEVECGLLIEAIADTEGEDECEDAGDNDVGEKGA